MKGSSLFKVFTSSNKQMKLNADVDNTFSTDQTVAGKFMLQTKTNPEAYSEDWHYRPFIAPNESFTFPHIDNSDFEADPVEIGDIDPLILNKSITSAKMTPTHSYNYVETAPSTQALLLPYLADERIVSNQIRVFHDNVAFVKSDDLDDKPADGGNFFPEHYMETGQSYVYDPYEQGHIFFAQTDLPQLDDGATEAQIAAHEINLSMQIMDGGVPASDDFRIKWNPAIDFPTGDEEIEYYTLGGAFSVNPGQDAMGGAAMIPLRPTNNENGEMFQADFKNYCVEFTIPTEAQTETIEQHTNNQGRTGVFRFRFRDVQLQLIFDKNGFGQTVKEGGEDDVGPFHVFKIFDRDTNTATGIPADGDPGYAAAFAASAPYGDLLIPGSVAERTNATTDLQGLDKFPFSEDEDGASDSTVYLFLPKRRFARKTQGSLWYNPFHRMFGAHFSALRGGVEPLEREIKEAVRTHDRLFYNYLRNVADGFGANLVVDSNISNMNSTYLGKLEPYWGITDGLLTDRDRAYRFRGYVADKGSTLHRYLKEIFEDDNTKWEDTDTFMILTEFSHDVVDDGDDFSPPEITQNRHHYMICFSKAAVERHNGVGFERFYIGEDAWKYPIILSEDQTVASRNLLQQFIAGSAYANGVVTDTNAQYPVVAGFTTPNPADLVHAPYFDEMRTGGHTGFLSETKKSELPVPPDEMKRPTETDNRIEVNYTVGDDYYSQTLQNYNYYLKYDADGVLDSDGGDNPRYHAIPTLPEEYEIEKHHFLNADGGFREFNDGAGNEWEFDTLDLFKARSQLSGKSYFLNFGDYVDGKIDKHTIPIVNTIQNAIVERTEPFLGFYGMSRFIPSGVYQTTRSLPPLLQDFSYAFAQRNMSELFVTGRDEEWFMNLKPVGELTLTVESANNFDQRDKELESVQMPFPKIEKFTKTFVKADSIALTCESTIGSPDFIFVHLRNDWETSLEPPIPKAGITIEELELYCHNQPIQSINELDSRMLYQVTRRNSHPYANHADNRQDTGAVFLSRRDCMNFTQFLGTEGIDVFPLEVYVKELNDHQENETPFLVEPNRILDVYFIHTDYALRGDANEMRFWREER